MSPSAAGSRANDEFFETAREVVLGLEMGIAPIAGECKSQRVAGAGNRVRSGPFDEAYVAAFRRNPWRRRLG